MNTLRYVIIGITLVAAAGCSGDNPVGPVYGLRMEHPDEATLTGYVDGSLSSVCSREVCTHLEQCARCDQAVAAMSTEDIERKQRP